MRATLNNDYKHNGTIMADFKTHTLAGSGVGLSLIWFSYIKDWANELPLLLLIYITAIIGSYLPDLDHDSGKPVRIVFTFFGIVGALTSFLLCYFRLKLTRPMIFFWTGAIYLLVRYLLSYLFKKFTKHRGMYHSIPMILISFLITYSITNLFDISKEIKLVLSSAVAMGFLSHLVLDEIFSAKTFLGIPYKMGKAFGSSLKLISKSRWATLICYLVLLLLMLLQRSLFSGFFN